MRNVDIIMRDLSYELEAAGIKCSIATYSIEEVEVAGSGQLFPACMARLEMASRSIKSNRQVIAIAQTEQGARRTLVQAIIANAEVEKAIGGGNAE